MRIVVYGETDKRCVIYTLLKLLQTLGDIALITDNSHYTRLIDGEETGTFENILISVSEYSPDEVLDVLGYYDDEFEHIVYDNQIPMDYDMFIYVQGGRMSERESEMLSYLDDYITVKIGFGDKSIPHSLNMIKVVEEIECYKMLKEVDKNVTKYLANLLSKPLNLPINTIRKVVARKR